MENLHGMLQDPTAVVSSLPAFVKENPGWLLLAIGLYFAVVWLRTPWKNADGAAHIKVPKGGRRRRFLQGLKGKGKGGAKIRKRDRIKMAAKLVLEKTMRQKHRFMGTQGGLPEQVKDRNDNLTSAVSRGNSRSNDVSHHIEDIIGSGLIANQMLNELCDLTTACEVGPGVEVCDIEDSVIVVVAGEIDMRNPAGKHIATRRAGEHVGSLLSFIGKLAGHTPEAGQLTAKAGLAGATYKRLPLTSISAAFATRPPALRRKLVTSGAQRLQRVMLGAVSNYLGLPSKLLKAYGAAVQKPSPELSPAAWAAQQLGCSAADLHGNGNSSAGAGAGAGGDSCYVVEVAKGCKLPLIPPAESVASASTGQPLYFLAEGALSEHIGSRPVNQEGFVEVTAGHFFGEIAALGSIPSCSTFVARIDSKLLCIPPLAVQRLLNSKPAALSKLIQISLDHLSPLVRYLDLTVSISHFEAGDAVFEEGTPVESATIVLSGRLRAVAEHDGGKQVAKVSAEYGRGEVLGDLEAFTGEVCPSSVHAVRDTEVVNIPIDFVFGLFEEHPASVLPFMRSLTGRALARNNKADVGGSGSSSGSSLSSSSMSSHRRSSVTKVGAEQDHHIRTVVLIPGNGPDGPGDISAFAARLAGELQRSLGNSNGSILHLSAASMAQKGFNPNGERRELSAWLGEQEDNHRLLLFEADPEDTDWTKLCISQADCILSVVAADAGPELGPLEKQMASAATRAQKELVILHTADTTLPRNTAAWLNLRPWCTRHHHLRCNADVLQATDDDDDDGDGDDSDSSDDGVSGGGAGPSSSGGGGGGSRAGKGGGGVEADAAAAAAAAEATHPHTGRLARRILGKSVGLVLGGGGAKGVAHAGVIEEMERRGIPIDVVGGTSIGSIVGALYAQEGRATGTRFRSRFKELAERMQNLLPMVMDLTYPSLALLTGRAFNRTIELTLGRTAIEDLWLPYYCVTTNLNLVDQRVHTDGSLWRYVRGSMTLTGFLPPICDPKDQHWLVDGGYANNLPVDVMQNQMGDHVTKVIACEVGSQYSPDLVPFGDAVSGMYVLWNNWFSRNSKAFSTSSEIQSRLSYLHNEVNVLKAKAADGIVLILPPVLTFGLLEWKSYDAIEAIGRSSSLQILDKVKKDWGY